VLFACFPHLHFASCPNRENHPFLDKEAWHGHRWLGWVNVSWHKILFDELLCVKWSSGTPTGLMVNWIKVACRQHWYCGETPQCNVETKPKVQVCVYPHYILERSSCVNESKANNRNDSINESDIKDINSYEMYAYKEISINHWVSILANESHTWQSGNLRFHDKCWWQENDQHITINWS
jgi:hypothetical protein